MDARSQYPTLRLIDRHGNWLSVLLGGAPILISAWAAMEGYSPLWFVAGIGSGIFAFVLARSYVELVRLITDMLLPR